MAPELPPTSSAAPGWYPDPQMVGTQRYWDGASWTGHVAPLAAAPGAAAAKGDPDDTGLVVAALVGAVLLPIVGIVCSIILLVRGGTGVGLGGLVLSFASIAFWWATFFSGPIGY